MKEPFRMLSRDYIGFWLRGLVRRGCAATKRPGLTLHALADYTGIPLESLRAFAERDNARMGIDRQRYLSAIIAKIENGLLIFEGGGRGRDRARVVEKPQPLRRYLVTFGVGGARITPAPRPPLPQDFPNPIGLTASKR